ncbi:alpha/beta-hydrolase [Xylariaceae sp. AK1471]|nr:alpha/beta-hydrolase [Xylariaceae sp. AK1471]
MAAEKPVIIIVHGAWHSPVHYRKLIEPLRTQGYTVLAPTNASVGIDDSIVGKTYIDDVKRIHEALLPHLDAGREAVMVCHSYGAIPGTASLEGQTVEERAARGLKGGVKEVLYYAAVAIPQRGMSLHTLERFNWPEWHRQEGELRLLTPQSEEIFYNDLPVEERRQIVASLLSQSQASLVTEAHYAPCDLKIPKTYVVCSQDKCIPPPSQLLMAQAAGAKVVEFDCGHSPHAKDAESAELVKLTVDMAA